MTSSIAVEIKENIKETLEKLGVNDPKVDLSHPELVFGDYTINSAMVYAKVLGKNPRELAETISNNIKSLDFISDIQIAGPGFINISISKEAIRNQVEKIVSEKYFDTTYTNKKVLVEHSSPNLFKPFHIGHLMNNTVGESIVRLMRAGGAEVKTTSFPSDVSLGIAKAMYIIEQDGRIQIQGNPINQETIEYLGQAYVDGVKFYDENEDKQQIIKGIADKIYDGNYPMYQVCKKINIEYFENTTKSLGSDFDSFIYESEAGVRGKDIILKNIKNPFVESEGAVVYIPLEERKDINTTVFINSQGNPTYAGKDIGLIDLKFEKYSPDLSIYTTDNEQIPHFKTVFAAAEEIDEIWKSRIDRSKHVPHGRMTFKGAKMSSRLGGVPLAEDIISTVIEEVRERSGERLDKFSNEEKEQRYKEIALAAIKFAILRSKPGSNINFDPETSLSFEGDSGPYVQYTHARCASLLKKSGIPPAKDEDKEITSLERIILRFENAATKAIEEFAPQNVVTYLFILCQEFNAWYANNPIIVEGDAAGTAHRLYVVTEVQKTIAKGLDMLAVSAPSEM